MSDETKASAVACGVIYYWWSGGTQFWLFTLYGKHEQNDLTPQHKKALKHMLVREIKARMHNET